MKPALKRAHPPNGDLEEPPGHTVILYSMAEMFSCPACGHKLFVCVAIKRQDRPDYETEFIACSKCKVMLWSPADGPRNKQAPPLLATWGAVPPSGDLKK